MNRVVRVASVLMLAFALGGCTAGATTTSTAAPSGAVTPNEGADVGNDRPRVTYDGLMVRRRVVIAIHTTPDANLTSLRKEMDEAATSAHTTLSGIAPTVLDAALLERLSPELTLSLPAGRTIADARTLINPAAMRSGSFPEVQEYDVASVLVHDLRFTVSSADPAVLAEAIAREGILSDALGNYSTTLGSGELDITYTGPLLSDDLVESVRVGIGRGAGTEPAAVTVSPRSTTGAGVDMAKEPALAPLVAEASTAHNHGAVPPAVSASSPASPWTVSVVALAVLLLLTLLLLMRRINQRPDERIGHVSEDGVRMR